MKIRCINNTGEALRLFDNKPYKTNVLDRFGSTVETQFGVRIGEEYLVMGMIFGQGSLAYLIDFNGIVSMYPSPLFQVIESKLPSSWYFSALKNSDRRFPYQEAIWGYYEFVHVEDCYEKLVDADEDTMRDYFKHKIALESQLDNDY